VRSMLGRTASLAGKVCFWLFGFAGFLVSLSIVEQAAGFWGFVVAFVVAPITFVAAPWYALVAWGNPFPLLITYGGTIASGFLFWAGAKITRTEGEC
jgi:hypothetical protein